MWSNIMPTIFSIAMVSQSVDCLLNTLDCKSLKYSQSLKSSLYLFSKNNLDENILKMNIRRNGVMLNRWTISHVIKMKLQFKQSWANTNKLKILQILTLRLKIAYLLTSNDLWMVKYVFGHIIGRLDLVESILLRGYWIN